ncbi:MAG: hypothetical protein ACYS8W_15770 [Planctomycetota bacterium]
MVRINMLPPEFRQAEGMYLPAVLLLLSGLGLAALWAAALLWFYGQVHKSEEYLARYKNIERRLTEKSRQLAKMDTEAEEKRSRSRAVMKIRSRKIFWARKLHRLAKLTPPGTIWWNRLEMKQLEPKAGLTNGGSLTVNCLQKGTDISTLNSYWDTIVSDRVFWLGFETFSPPDVQKLRDMEVLEYPIVLYLEPPALETTRSAGSGHVKGGG